MLTPEEMWRQVLTRLHAEMPRASYESWVRDTGVVSLEKNGLTISARNAYARDWLESRLTAVVQNILKGILDQPVSVRFIASATPPADEQETGTEEETGLDIEPVQWLDYDRIVQPHKQVVVKGYLRRLGREIGPKAVWLYIGFHQAAWRVRGSTGADAKPLHSREVMRFSGLSHGAFWRLLKDTSIQGHLHGLVQRAEDAGTRRFRRGRDGRPHRAPVRYQVFMTPRLTRADATAVHLRFKTMIQTHASISSALREMLAAEDLTELFTPLDMTLPHPPLNTVMDMARLETGQPISPEIEQLAQDLHRRLVGCLGDIHIAHFFLTRTIHDFQLTPAQAWLVTVARDMAFINLRTGERRDLVTFKGGYREMAELIGSGRYKTVQAWLNPQWSGRRGGNLARFLVERYLPDSDPQLDLRVESMPRAFRVLLDEPLDADGSHMADAIGSMCGTQMEGSADASGSHRLDAHGTVLNSFKHLPNTDRKNTATPHPAHCAGTEGAVPEYWELASLLQQNDVHPKVQKELLQVQASVHAFVSWVLYAASPKSGNLLDPLGYALSRLREHPLREARGAFRQFADLPPLDLLRLIESTPHSAYAPYQPIDHPLAPAWKRTMGSHPPGLSQVRAILFGGEGGE